MAREPDDDETGVDRRRFMQLAGASAAAMSFSGFMGTTAAATTVDLADKGLTNGDQIDPYLDEHFAPGNRVRIPAGEYAWSGSGLDGTFDAGAELVGDGDVVFRVQESYNGTIRAESGTVRVSNIEVRNEVTNDSRLRLEAGESGEVLVEQLRFPDGGAPGEHNRAFYVPPEHAGKVHVHACFLQNFCNNGIYASEPGRPADNGSGSAGQGGQVVVTNTYVRNCNVAGIRVGGPDAVVRRCVVVNDAPCPANHVDERYPRGIRIRQPGENITIEDCDVTMTVADDAAAPPIDFADESAGGSGVIRNVRIRNDTGNAPITTDWDTSGAWSGRNISVTGSGNLSLPSNFAADSCVGDGCPVPKTEPPAAGDTATTATAQPDTSLLEVVPADGAPQFSYEFTTSGAVEEAADATVEKSSHAGDLDTGSANALAATGGEKRVSGEVSSGSGASHELTGAVDSFSADTDASNYYATLDGAALAAGSAAAASTVQVDGYSGVTSLDEVQLPSVPGEADRTVVDLGQQGLSDGDDVRPYLEQHVSANTYVKIPPGTYQWGATDALADMANVTIEGQGAPGDVVFSRPGSATENTIQAAEGTCRVSNITMKGGLAGDSGKLRAIAAEGATVIVDRVQMPDGAASGAGSMGFYVSDTHSGDAWFVDCVVVGFADNGLYASNARGPVHVIGGYYANNNANNVRLGSTGSRAVGVVMVHDRQAPPDEGGGIAQRGFGVKRAAGDTPGKHIHAADCDIVHTYTGDGSASPVDVSDKAAGSTGWVVNTRIRNETENPAVTDEWSNFSEKWGGAPLFLSGGGNLSTPSGPDWRVNRGSDVPAPRTSQRSVSKPWTGSAGSGSGATSGSSGSSSTSGTTGTSGSSNSSTTTTTTTTTSSDGSSSGDDGSSSGDGTSSDDSAESSALKQLSTQTSTSRSTTSSTSPASDDGSTAGDAAASASNGDASAPDEESSSESGDDADPADDSSGSPPADADSSNGDAALEPTYGSADSGHLLKVVSAADVATVTYEVDVRGTVEKVTGNGGLGADDNDALVRHDDGTVTVRGDTGHGYGDTFRVDGTLLDFRSDADSASYRLYVDGVEVAPDSVGTSAGAGGASANGAGDGSTSAGSKSEPAGKSSGKSGSSESVDAEPKLPNVVTIDGVACGGPTSYRIAVTGRLAPNPGVGKLSGADAIDGGTATGVVNDGVDSFRYSGEVTEFHVDGTAAVSFENDDQ